MLFELFAAQVQAQGSYFCGVLELGRSLGILFWGAAEFRV